MLYVQSGYFYMITLMLYVQSGYFYMIHLCYMYRVVIGGNLVTLSKESGMQKTRTNFFRLPSAIHDTCTSVCEKHWLQGTDKSKSNFQYLAEVNC